MHVSREKIVPLQGAPVYIGQTIVEVSAIVIAQLSNHGSIHVLAAFASEGMEIEKRIKLLKRVWKAVALAGLVVAVGGQLFLFSHYFLIPFSYQISITRLTLQTLPNHDSVPFKTLHLFWLPIESTFLK